MSREAPGESAGRSPNASGNLLFRRFRDSLAEFGFAGRQRTIGRIGKATADLHCAPVLEAIKERNCDGARQAMRRPILTAGENMDLEALTGWKSK